MAQNKKPKVDFSTALKAKAEELAPKPESNPDEEFLANINGEDVRFIRGDSTDAEWAAIKARPAATQRVVVKPEPGSKSPASTALVTRKPNETDAEWRGRAIGAENHPRYDSTVETSDADQKDARREQYKALISNQAYEGGDGALVSKDELKLLRGMDPEKAADFLDERTKQREYADEQKNKPAQVAPSAKPEAPAPAPTSADKFDYLQPEASAGPGMSPRANMQAMAMGATPSPTGNPMLDDIKEVAQPVVDSVKQQIAGPPPSQNPMVGAPPNIDGPMQNPPLASVGNFVKNVAAPDPGAWPGAITNEQAATLPPSPNAPGAQMDPMAEIDAMNKSASDGASASASIKMPSGFTPAQEDPKFAKNLDESIAGAKQRAVDLQDLQAANEVVQDGIVRETGKRRLEAEAQMNAEAGLAAQAKLNAVSEAQRYNGARQAALAAAQQAAQTPTDPNRYWNNKDDGQKAAAVIAGALFGFTGQGMNWLQRIDGLIENDMRAQTADRASKVQGLESQARGYGEAADFAMKAGASEAEAHVIARQMKLESLNSYLQQMVMKSNNMQQKVVGQQMMVELQGKMAGLDQQALAVNAQSTAQKNENLYRNASLAQGAAKISAALSKGGKSARAVSPQLAARVANTQQLIGSLEKMKSLAKNTGVIDRATRRVGEELTSDESGKADEYKALQFEIARLRAGSSLQKPEQEALLPLIRPRSGRLDAVPGIDEAIKRAKDALQIEMRVAREATAGSLDSVEAPPSEDDFGFEAAQ